MGRFFSAHIGINYAGTQHALGGCVNDAKDLAAHFGAIAVKCGGTADRLLERSADLPGIRDFLAENLGRLKADDTLFLSRSGHGTQTRDRNGDEQDGLDECFVSFSLELLGDDEFAEILTRRTPGSRVIVFDDCCHSGGGSRLLGSANQLAHDRPKYIPVGLLKLLSSRDLGRPGRASTDGVLHISACQPHEVAWDTGTNGAATIALHAAAKNVSAKTWGDLFAGVSKMLPTKRHPQTPTMTGAPGGSSWPLPTPGAIAPPPVMLGLPDVLTINGLRYRREA